MKKKIESLILGKKHISFCDKSDKPVKTFISKSNKKSLNPKDDKKKLKKIKKWIFDNHMHHNNEFIEEIVKPCSESDSPYVNSLELEKFIEKLYES